MEPKDQPSDRDLLAAYAGGDASAFSELARRSGAMVHATCRRVLGDAQLAQDAAQETFLQLTRDAASVRGCVGAWLHRVATNKALDLARAEGRLRRREAAIATRPVEARAWSELSGLVDEALEDLPDDQRDLLVRHFLEGASQQTLAGELAVSQATVSRRLSEAVDALRARVRTRGMVGTPAMIGEGFATDAIAPLPDRLGAELGRLAMTARPGAVLSGAGWIPPLAMTTIIAVVLAAIAVGIAHLVSPPAITAPPAPTRPTAPGPAMAATGDPIDQPLVMRAVDAICAGDAPTLRQLLVEHPALVHARVESDTGHYSGYFHHATLLHHVAGNPLPGTVPANILEIARILLDAGAAVDARTDAGPSQPDDPGWTTLALVVSAGDALRGHLDALVDLLVARGADVDADEGSVLGGALQYACWDGATALLRHGVKLDLRFAAAVGDVERLRSCFAEDGTLRPGASFLCGYPQAPHGPTGTQGGYTQGPHPQPESAAAQLAEALIFASSIVENPRRLEVARILLDHGAKPTMTPLGHSALHSAAWIGDAELCTLLIANGADPGALDAQYQSSPAGWADFNHHPECADAVRRSSPKASPEKPTDDGRNGF